MRYASIRDFDITNGEGIGIALFVQGCDFHCKNCFNSSTWDFNGGKEWTTDTEELFIELANKDYISRITILGGEPMHIANRSAVLLLCQRLKQRYPNKKIWLYTGYVKEELGDTDLSCIDYLVDGRFIDELKDYKLKYRGSSNQHIWDIKRRVIIDNEFLS